MLGPPSNTERRGAVSNTERRGVASNIEERATGTCGQSWRHLWPQWEVCPTYPRGMRGRRKGEDAPGTEEGRSRCKKGVDKWQGSFKWLYPVGQIQQELQPSVPPTTTSQGTHSLQPPNSTPNSTPQHTTLPIVPYTAIQINQQQLHLPQPTPPKWEVEADLRRGGCESRQSVGTGVGIDGRPVGREGDLGQDQKNGWARV